MKKPVVIVLGKNYSTALGVIRALGEAGYSIELFYITGKKGGSRIASVSKYVKYTMEQIGRKDEEIVNKLLRRTENSEQQYILFPTDDYTASLIDRHRDMLKPHFLMPYVQGQKQGAVTYYMDKAVQLKLASQFGLRTAATWDIDLDHDKICLPEEITFPCFCKPTVSARGFKREICTCVTREELKQTLSVLQQEIRKRSILVQEFLKIDDEFSVSGVCLGDTVYLPALLKKLCIAEHEKGVTLLGKVCPLNELDSAKKCIEEMLASIHYYGMIDIELICSGGEIYFNELNFRSSGVSYAITYSGINLPALLVQNLTRNTCDIANQRIKYGLKFLYDKAAFEDYIFGDISRAEFENYSNTADFTMLHHDSDPEPEKFFLKEMRRKKRREKLKQIVPVRFRKGYIKQGRKKKDR